MRVSVTGQEAWGFSPFSPMFLPLLSLLKGTKGEMFKGSPFSVILCPHGHFLPLTSPHSPVLHPRNTGRGMRGRGAM